MVALLAWIAPWIGSEDYGYQPLPIYKSDRPRTVIAKPLRLDSGGTGDPPRLLAIPSNPLYGRLMSYYADLTSQLPFRLSLACRRVSHFGDSREQQVSS